MAGNTLGVQERGTKGLPSINMTSRQTEISRLAAVKAQLLATTHTTGWGYCKKIAENVVSKAIQEALDERDREIAGDLRIKAKAMQQGFAEYFSAIEAGMSFDPEQFKDQSGLGELEEAWSGNGID